MLDDRHVDWMFRHGVVLQNSSSIPRMFTNARQNPVQCRATRGVAVFQTSTPLLRPAPEAQCSQNLATGHLMLINSMTYDPRPWWSPRRYLFPPDHSRYGEGRVSRYHWL